MKLVTYRTANGTRAGRLDGDQVIELPDADVGTLLARGEEGIDDARRAPSQTRTYADLDLAPVIPDPPKIICVGQNYLAHIQEQNVAVPERPTLFNKFSLCLIGAKDPIVIPAVSDQVDWEVELAIVIGKRARHVEGAAAEDAIFGYTILNDTSIRDWQFRTTQWMQGKAFESSTPLGPVVVSRDELDPNNLHLWTDVDGVRMQDSNTSDLLFKPAQIVAYISQFITLEPGDVIPTGTPSGVAVARKPQPWLRPGQTVRCGIDGIGELVNRCVKEG